jgi:acetyl esterase/lipase
MLELWPTLTLSTDVLPAMRTGVRKFAPPPIDPAIMEAVGAERRQIPGPAGAPEIEIVIYQPHATAKLRPCLLHFHGGGYVAGKSAASEPALRPLALELDCVIVSVDYRLAPESPYPGAIDDCYATLAWANRFAAELGIDSARIGVMGESAGGGLAAALALLARDRGEYALRFQHLIYPMLDDRTGCVTAPNPETGEFIWTPHNNRFGWRALLGHEPGIAGVSPYAAAARATDLSRLPPAYIAVPTLDLFLDEDIAYAHRLLRAGVEVELHVYPGGFHGFDLWPAANVSQRARADSRAALRRAMCDRA